MKSAVSLALALFTATGFAQAPSRAAAVFADPANLMGERVKPKDGRELPIDQGASGLAQLLRKLNTRASILNIVAHPDDEDGGMLTFYARGLGARVADISLTRGEGGQNAVTADFEDALGLLRTQELLANDRYTGVDQMFGTEADFGFSKTKEEAFAKWTHERVLYDVVRAIRLYRPLVLTSTWVGGVTDGHGQHQVSGEIAQEAFVKAGDPSVFPEMIAEGILPWQPLKVYARVPMQAITKKGLFDYATGQYTPAKFTNYVTGEVTSTPPSADVLVHEGQTDPILTLAAANPADLVSGLEAASRTPTDTAPLSYVQFARIGLGLQKTQIGSGFRPAQAGQFDVAYHLYGSRLPASTSASPKNQVPSARPIPAQGTTDGPTQDLDPTFFDGIDTSLESIAADIGIPDIQDKLASIDTHIRAATAQFDPTRPETIAPGLTSALKLTDELILTLSTANNSPPAQTFNILHELRIKRTQLNDAVVLALGISLEAIVETSPQSTASLAFDAATPSESNIQPDSGFYVLTRLDKGLLADPNDRNTPKVLLKEESHNFGFARNLALYPPTRPYFSRLNIEQPFYDLSNRNLRNAPQTPPAQVADASLDDNGVQLNLATVVTGTTVLASGAVIRQPMSFVPAVGLALTTHAQVVAFEQTEVPIAASVSPASRTAEIHWDAPRNWKVLPAPTAANCPGCSQWLMEVPRAARTPATVRASIPLDNRAYTEGYRPIGYGDLPRTNYYTPAETRIVPVDLNLPARHKIAYLPGTGDAVPEALASIGLAPTILTVADLTPANLAQYDTVVLGVRTYAAHPDLHGDPTQALFDYARRGGNVVVQYQTVEFTAADAPYPLALGSNEKVVDETAPVRLIDEKIDPGVRLFYAPNHITPADFNQWIEERGHGFLSAWDPHYSAPTETHDPGQDPQRGGLVTVKMGDNPKHQGRWTYCAFALYRQLPEAVPGAYRFFMNLLEPE